MALDARDHARGMARLLREQRFAVLATQETNAPYVSLVAFAASPDLRLVYFATLGATRKGRALDSSPCVAMLVDDRRNDLRDLEHATALTLTGVATRLEGHVRDAASAAYLRVHPRLAGFLDLADCRLYAMEIRTCHVAARFGDGTPPGTPDGVSAGALSS